MNAQAFHHVVALAFATPLFLITSFVAAKSPAWLNPWNGEPFGRIWILVLPALISSIGIAVNAGIGLLRSRARSPYRSKSEP